MSLESIGSNVAILKTLQGAGISSRFQDLRIVCQNMVNLVELLIQKAAPSKFLIVQSQVSVLRSISGAGTSSRFGDLGIVSQIIIELADYLSDPSKGHLLQSISSKVAVLRSMSGAGTSSQWQDMRIVCNAMAELSHYLNQQPVTPKKEESATTSSSPSSRQSISNPTLFPTHLNRMNKPSQTNPPIISSVTQAPQAIEAVLQSSSQEDAHLLATAYEPISEATAQLQRRGLLAQGWELDERLSRDARSGSNTYKVTVLHNRRKNCTVIAIPGTRFLDGATLSADIQFALNREIEMYNLAERHYQDVIAASDRQAHIILLGHSLGGVLAQLLFLNNDTGNLRCRTFESPGIKQYTDVRQLSIAEPQKQRLTLYRSKYDNMVNRFGVHLVNPTSCAQTAKCDIVNKLWETKSALSLYDAENGFGENTLVDDGFAFWYSHRIEEFSAGGTASTTSSNSQQQGLILTPPVINPANIPFREPPAYEREARFFMFTAAGGLGGVGVHLSKDVTLYAAYQVVTGQVGVGISIAMSDAALLATLGGAAAGAILWFAYSSYKRYQQKAQEAYVERLRRISNEVRDEMTQKFAFCNRLPAETVAELMPYIATLVDAEIAYRDREYFLNQTYASSIFTRSINRLSGATGSSERKRREHDERRKNAQSGIKRIIQRFLEQLQEYEEKYRAEFASIIPKGLQVVQANAHSKSSSTGLFAASSEKPNPTEAILYVVEELPLLPLGEGHQNAYFFKRKGALQELHYAKASGFELVLVNDIHKIVAFVDQFLAHSDSSGSIPRIPLNAILLEELIFANQPSAGQSNGR